MNCYSAHLSIGVHCSLEQKKEIIIIFYSQHSFTLSRSEHSFTLSSSLSSPTRPPQAHSGTTCFFFFFILSNPVSFTLSISLSALISSLSSSLSQCRQPDHRQRHHHHQVQTYAANLPRRTSLSPIHFRSVSVFFMWMLWVFDLGILFHRSADPLWVFDLDPLHVDVSVFIFDI